MDAVKLHLAINHFPIVAALIGLFILIYGSAKNSLHTVAAACWVFLAGAASGTVAFFSGAASEDLAHDVLMLPVDLTHEHRDLATYTFLIYIVVAVLAVVMLIRMHKLKALPSKLLWALLLVAIATSAMAVYTGHVGGKIRHTELTDNAFTAPN